MTHIRIIGGRKRRRDWAPARFVLACIILVGTLSLFGAMALAADGLARKAAFDAAEARI